MMDMLVYESPNHEKRRSQPIREDDLAQRRVLARQGWQIVSRTPIAEAAEPETEDWREPSDDLPNGGETPPVAFLDTLAFLNAEQRAALTDAGLATEDAIRAATDDVLRDVPKIGPAAVRDIRAALLPQGQPPTA